MIEELEKEIAKLKIICPDDEKTAVDVEVDLTKINVEMDEKHNPRIELTDNIGILCHIHLWI